MTEHSTRVTIATRTTSSGQPIHVVHDPPPATREWETQPGARRYATTVDLGNRTVRVRAVYKRGDLDDRPRFELTIGEWGGPLLFPAVGRPTRYVFARGMGSGGALDIDVIDAGLTFALDRAARLRTEGSE